MSKGNNRKKKPEPKEKITKTVLEEDLHGFTLVELRIKPRKKPAYYRWVAFNNRRLQTGPKDDRVLFYRSEYIIEQTHDLVSGIGYPVNQHGVPLHEGVQNLHNPDPVHIGVLTSMLKAKVAMHKHIQSTKLVVPEHIEKQRQAELLESSLSVMEDDDAPEETITHDSDELPAGQGTTEKGQGEGQDQPQVRGDREPEGDRPQARIITVPGISHVPSDGREEDGAGEDTADSTGEQVDEGNGLDVPDQSKDGQNPT